MKGDLIHLDKRRFRKDPIKQLDIEYNRFKNQAKQVENVLEKLKEETTEVGQDMYKKFLIRRVSEGLVNERRPI